MKSSTDWDKPKAAKPAPAPDPVPPPPPPNKAQPVHEPIKTEPSVSERIDTIINQLAEIRDRVRGV